MSSKFVVSHLEEQMGPFDEAELKAKWARGELLPIDYVYDETKQDWVLFSEKFPWATAQVVQATPAPAAEENVPAVPPPLAEAVRKPRVAMEPTAIAAKKVTLGAPVKVEAPEIPAKTAENKGTPVNLVDGVGEVEISSLQPGDVEFAVKDSTLQLQTPLRIHVKSAEPKAIEWTLPAEQTVGEDVEIHVQAVDASGHVCSGYDDSFQIRINGGNSGTEGNQITVPLKQGRAIIKIQHTKAETWRLTFHYNGTRVLKMPADRAIEWHPGPATKLILDGPQEYTAGHPLKVAVRAVDQFGNLAKTFHGTVVLEVKAS